LPTSPNKPNQNFDKRSDTNFTNLTSLKDNIANEANFNKSKPKFTQNTDRRNQANFTNLRSQPETLLTKKRRLPKKTNLQTRQLKNRNAAVKNRLSQTRNTA